MTSAIDEELERAKTDGRSWYHADKDRPPRDVVLAWRDGRGYCKLAQNVRPAGFREWAFMR